MTYSALAILAGVAALLLTLLIERQAGRLGLMQAPNHRSSHIKPTARGGGIAIIGAAIVAMMVLCAMGAPQLWGVVGATDAIAGLGLADDLRDLPAAWRFPIQGLVMAGLLWSVPALPSIALPWGLFLGGALLAIVVWVIGLWWVNLFNFMDGIDGIAASQAILILMGGCLVWWTAEPDAIANPVFAVALIAMAASAGFLLRNWPPAHIFMGDAGSNGLALIIFAIAALTIAEGGVPYQSWLILPSVFVTDATVTLLRRIARLEKPWDAHRRHGYQQLARRWGHRTVTLAYGALTLFGAIPLAWLAQSASVWSWALVAAVYGVWAGLALWAGAGASTETVPA